MLNYGKPFCTFVRHRGECLKMKVYLFILSFLSVGLIYAQNEGGNVSYNHFKSKSGSTPINLAVKGSGRHLQNNENIHYKYKNGDWHFIYCTPNQVSDLMEDGIVEQIYFNPAQPVLMNDTMRIVQNIDSVHNGAAPLQSPFTGKDVIIGYVDSGIDYNHEDFKNEDGSTRVLYYWDHTLAFDAERTPSKYGYGQVWTNADIDAGDCGSLDGNAHGTTVSGAGSGNGRATGTHKGVAPESDIIVVESNFSLPNWTLTIADAVDFIFSMADTLGKPAVVNASLGTYLGSHDGTDPAAHVIDSLLDDLPGRIMVAAAGNSGNQGKYHVKGIVDVDTSYCWFDVNPSSAFGVPATYFDLWADSLDFKDVSFAFGADRVDPDFEFRGRTAFYDIEPLLGTTTYDTIWSPEGDLITPIQFSAEEINGVYHIEMVMLDPDSADYYFRFETTGSGTYDLWSGAWLGASDIVSTGLPTVDAFPSILHYHAPDTLSTIVSSWTCSPKVVTVGNFKNQYDYIDSEGEPFVLSGGPVGQLSVNSSKGPNRRGHVKPDVSASGDGITSACPLWLSATLIDSNPSMLALGGQHVRNGGTSMASPVIAGIAALYLEKCPQSTYQDFLDDLHTLAYEDLFTETTPNNAYGYGKVDAFNLLNASNFDVQVLGDTLICDDPEIYTTSGVFDSYSWFNAETTSTIELNESAEVYTMVANERGCVSYSDTLTVIKGTLPIYPTINVIGGGLITTPADSFIWYYNGEPIDDSNSQYYNPDTTGDYTVQVFSPEGCSYTSDIVYIDLSQIDELKKNDFVILPNPFVDQFHIIKSDFINVNLVVTDMSGKLVYNHSDIGEDDLFIEVDLSTAESGIYLLSLYYDNNFKSFKLIKK